MLLCRGTEIKALKLVGEVNEASLHISNIKTGTLLDTGSCVSIISEAFHDSHLSEIRINPRNGGF